MKRLALRNFKRGAETGAVVKTKKELISALAGTRDERLMLAGLLDKEQANRQHDYMTYTKFLSMGEHALCVEAVRQVGAASHAVFWGGYEEAERGIYLFYPDYLDEESAKAAAPLTLLRAHKRKEDVLTHRDYLGALMGLQIDRAMVGDILVYETGADLLVLNEIADFIELHLTQAGRAQLTITREPLSSLRQAHIMEKEGSGSVASPRLDSMAALIFGLGRKEAKDKIEKGLVFVNSLPCQKPEDPIFEGDRLSIRGFGRARIGEFGKISRKGRMFVKFVKTV